MPRLFAALFGSCLALATIVSGCGSASKVDADSPGCEGPSCVPNASAACPEGLALDAATGACMDVSPAGDCAPGTGAFLGSTTCRPVGWTTCAPPFEADPSGWGCQPIVASTCPAGSLGALGSPACKPVGDCSVPFPPADASLFVDATFAATDATHFTSLFQATQSAKAGDVIAVAPGTYVEDVDVARSNISIVGKCASQVIIQNPGDRRSGILVTDGARNVRVRGLTLTGHYSGILVKGGSEARIEDSLILKNRYLGAYSAETGSRLEVVRTLIDDVVAGDADKFGWGAAAQLGGALELEDVVIHAPTGAGIVIGGPKSTGKLTRVVVRSPRVGTSGSASALGVVDGGAAEIDGALFEDLQTMGVNVSGGTARARHLLVRKTSASKTIPETGRGIQVSKGGSLVLSESLVTGSDDANVLVVDPGVTAKITSSTFVGSAASDPTRGFRGVRVGRGATLDIQGSAIIDSLDAGLSAQDPGSHITADGVLVTGTRALRSVTGEPVLGLMGVGVGVSWGSTLTLSHASIDKNLMAGILVTKPHESGAVSHADITSTLVRRSQPDASGYAGRGIEVSFGGTASIEGCAVAENNEHSIVVGNSSRMKIARTAIRDTRQHAGTFGHGLLTADGGSVSLDEVWLLGHPGIGIAIADADATIARSLVARSGVGIAVAGATSLQTAEHVPEAPGALTCIVSNDTRFLDNQTRVGSGAVPLPEPLRPPPTSPIRTP